MGTGPDDRFASRQPEDADIEKTADQGAEGSDYEIEGPFIHRQLRNRSRIGPYWLLGMPNEIN